MATVFTDNMPWQQFWADCPCGWTGRKVRNQQDARAHARQHEAAPSGEGLREEMDEAVISLFALAEEFRGIASRLERALSGGAA